MCGSFRRRESTLIGISHRLLCARLDETFTSLGCEVFTSSFREIRPEYEDFMALLGICDPKSMSLARHKRCDVYCGARETVGGSSVSSGCWGEDSNHENG